MLALLKTIAHVTAPPFQISVSGRNIQKHREVKHCNRKDSTIMPHPSGIVRFCEFVRSQSSDSQRFSVSPILAAACHNKSLNRIGAKDAPPG